MFVRAIFLLGFVTLLAGFCAAQQPPVQNFGVVPMLNAGGGDAMLSSILFKNSYSSFIEFIFSTIRIPFLPTCFSLALLVFV